MPRQKITPEMRVELDAAYDEWTGRESIDQLLQPFGVSKQAFYADRRRRGLPLKSDRPVPLSLSGEGPVAEVLLNALVEAKMRIRSLEAEVERLQRTT